MMKKNDHAVALVTGASSGIGEATAVRLAEAGYKVFGTSRRGASASPSSFEILPLDVTRGASVKAVVAEVIQREGRIDLLVNNAGFNVAAGGAEESSIQQAQDIFDTNFFGIVRMTLAIVPHMRQQGGGRIINIGSVLGFMAMPYMALYAATKHAIEGYSKSLDHELRNMGIRVSVIEPAFMKTALDAYAVAGHPYGCRNRDVRSAMDKRLKEMLDVAEDPEVVADTVLKVARAASPKARYTSGTAAARLRLMHTLLPAILMDAGIRKQLRIA
jgi:NAD(P)-dependent dehydrogenase (short-subunit alcohol dehydrogenase family)